MQKPNRLNERLTKYLYPPKNEYEREIDFNRSPIIPNQFSYLSNESANKKPTLNLYYGYDDQQDSPSATSYILNKELSRNALGNPKDENQFSVLDNNYTSFSYANKNNKPEGRVYHYSIASRKDYSRDKEEDYNLTYYYPEKKSRKYYIEKRVAPYTDKKYNYRRNDNNLLPTKVYISDSYFSNNKSENSQFRPSREKDGNNGSNGNKGGIVNLKRKRYSGRYDIEKVILIQRWWRNILYSISSQNENQYYQSIAERKYYSRRNERITEKIIPGQNDKFIVQTTRVEVFKRPYLSKPLLKPEIITKEIKENNKKSNFETNKDYYIEIEKENLKQYMRNIWNEENQSTNVVNLRIIQLESLNINNYSERKRITINEYEEQIRQLKIELSKKEKALIEANNKLKSLSNKRILIKDINDYEYINEENYLKREDIALLGKKQPFYDNLKIQLVGNLVIQNPYNIEIIPIEKEPLKKQLIDSLYIEGGQEILQYEIEELYTKKKLQQLYFPDEKTIIEEKDNIQILPLPKEPLKKQLVDSLYIERIFIRPENEIQFINQLDISRTLRPKNIVMEIGDNLEILPIEKEPLKKQLVDALYIEGIMLSKSENIIQNVDKLYIMKAPRGKNVIELKDNIEIYPIEKKPLKKQLVDYLYIERLIPLKPENKIQNTDQLSIFRTPKPKNIIEPKDTLEILPKEKEPLKKQIIDSLQIEGLSTIKVEIKIQNTDQLTIFRTQRPENIIEIKDFLEILPTEKEPLKKQLVDDLYIERVKTIKPENEIQNTDHLSIFKLQKPLNTIETRDNIELLSIEKLPLKKQLVDDLYIEKMVIIKPENKIQNIDKISIFTLPRSQNSIESKDNIEILPIKKEPLSSQVVDAILIEGIEKKDNQIQQTSLMTILKSPKTPNIIESTEDLFINAKEKEKLKYQNIDKLLIEGNEKAGNKIQVCDQLEIFKTPKQKKENIIEERDNIKILPIEKDPLKNQVVDSIIIEAKNRDDNKIQILDKMEILKTPKPQNKIEIKDNILLEPLEKEPLKKQLTDELLIESDKKLINNEIQVVDKMEILRTPKPQNKIEIKDNILLEPLEKEPLKKQLTDDLMIESTKKPNNQIQVADKMEILRTPKAENKIEDNLSLFIPKKEKEKLKNQNVDSILIESINKP